MAGRRFRQPRFGSLRPPRLRAPESQAGIVAQIAGEADLGAPPSFVLAFPEPGAPAAALAAIALRPERAGT
jgi:hypothetical protein